jgi:hypothetical protein
MLLTWKKSRMLLLLNFITNPQYNWFSNFEVGRNHNKLIAYSPYALT